MIFALYDYYPDGSECDTGKTFSVTKQESDEAMDRFNFGKTENIDDYGILLVMFKKIFNFTIGPNGFRIVWDTMPDGTQGKYVSGRLYWPGPANPNAIKCGGYWWKIKRIT